MRGTTTTVILFCFLRILLRYTFLNTEEYEAILERLVERLQGPTDAQNAGLFFRHHVVAAVASVVAVASVAVLFVLLEAENAYFIISFYKSWKI